MTLKPAPTRAKLNAGRSGLGQRASAASRTSRSGSSIQGRRVSTATLMPTESIHLRRRQVVHVTLLGSAAVCSQQSEALAVSLDTLRMEQGGDEEPVAEPGDNASGSGDQKGGRGRLKDNGERIPEEEVVSGSERGDTDVDSDSASDSSDSESGSDSESDSDSEGEEGQQKGAPPHQDGEDLERGKQGWQQGELEEGEEWLRRKEAKRLRKQERREQLDAQLQQQQQQQQLEVGPGRRETQEAMSTPAPSPAATAATQQSVPAPQQQGPPQKDVLHHWTSDSGAEPDGLLAELLL